MVELPKSNLRSKRASVLREILNESDEINEEPTPRDNSYRNSYLEQNSFSSMGKMRISGSYSDRASQNGDQIWTDSNLNFDRGMLSFDQPCDYRLKNSLKSKLEEDNWRELKDLLVGSSAGRNSKKGNSVIDFKRPIAVDVISSGGDAGNTETTQRPQTAIRDGQKLYFSLHFFFFSQ